MLCVKHLPPDLRRWTGGGGRGGGRGCVGRWLLSFAPQCPPHHSPGVLPDEGFLLGALPPLRRAPIATPDLLLPIPAEFWGRPPPHTHTPVPSVPPLPLAAPHRAGGGGKGGGGGGKGINLFRSTSHQKRLIRTCNFSGNITVKCHGAVGRRPGEGGQLSPRAPGAASLSICETKAGCV